MSQFSIIIFLAASIPEGFLMAFFVWFILGKKESVKFLNVIISGAVIAVSFEIIRIIFNYQNETLTTLLQAVAFPLIVYFFYKLNFIESIVGSLITMVVIAVTQGTSVNLGLLITRHSIESASDILQVLLVIPEFMVIGLFSLILHVRNIKLFNLNKKRKLSEFYSNKIRYLVLQLTFALLIILFNYRIFFVNIGKFTTNADIVLIAVSFSVIIIFTILVVNSAFKMGSSIQKEEELRRKYDGREVIQNIDYLCTLIDSKDYSEAKSVLKSMKVEVDKGMINNNRNNGV